MFWRRRTPDNIEEDVQSEDAQNSIENVETENNIQRENSTPTNLRGFESSNNNDELMRPEPPAIQPPLTPHPLMGRELPRLPSAGGGESKRDDDDEGGTAFPLPGGEEEGALATLPPRGGGGLVGADNLALANAHTIRSLALADLFELELQHQREANLQFNHLNRRHAGRPEPRRYRPRDRGAAAAASEAASSSDPDDLEFRINNIWEQLTAAAAQRRQERESEEQRAGAAAAVSSAGLLEVTLVQGLCQEWPHTTSNLRSKASFKSSVQSPGRTRSRLGGGASPAGGRPLSFIASVRVEGSSVSRDGSDGQVFAGTAVHPAGEKRCPIWDKTFFFEVVDFFGPAKIEINIFTKQWFGKTQLYGTVSVPMMESLRDVSRERWQRKKQAQSSMPITMQKWKADDVTDLASAKDSKGPELGTVEAILVCDCLCYPFSKGRSGIQQARRSLTKEEAEDVYLDFKRSHNSSRRWTSFEKTLGRPSIWRKWSRRDSNIACTSGEDECHPGSEEKSEISSESSDNYFKEGSMNDSWYLLSKGNSTSHSPPVVPPHQLPSVRLRLRYLSLSACCDPEMGNGGPAVLHRAAREGQVDLVLRMVDFYSKVGSYLQTHPLLVEALDPTPPPTGPPAPRASRSPEAEDPVKCTVLEVALRHGQLGVARALLKQYANLAVQSMKPMRATSCLHAAVESRNAAVLQLALQELTGAVRGSALQQSLVDLRDIGGRTALARACQLGDVDAVNILLKHGADLASRDLDSNTPFIFACQNGHAPVAKVLMKRKRDFEDERKLRGAGYEHSVEVLMACQPCLTNDFGKSGVMLAAEQGHVKVLSELLEAGVQWRRRDKNGRTPLHWAAECGRLKAVKFFTNDLKEQPNTQNAAGDTVNASLLEGGLIGVDTQDYFGQTALSLAEKQGHHEVVSFLEDYRQRTPKDCQQPIAISTLDWTAIQRKASLGEACEDTDSYAEDSEYEYQISETSD